MLFCIVVGLSLHHGPPVTLTPVIGTGFAGGHMTLSAWAWECLALAEAGDLLEAGLNIVDSLARGLEAAAVGLGLALL